jgi:hypothetical protein
MTGIRIIKERRETEKTMSIISDVLLQYNPINMNDSPSDLQSSISAIENSINIGLLNLVGTNIRKIRNTINRTHLFPQFQDFTPSEEILKATFDLLGENYDICKDVMIYVSLHNNGNIPWSSTTELRDVLDHIASAFLNHNKDLALKEISYAYEHIRRGSAESLQKLVRDNYYDWWDNISKKSSNYSGERVVNWIMKGYAQEDFTMKINFTTFRAQKTSDGWRDAVYDLMKKSKKYT